MTINGWDIQVATVRGVIGKARATVEDLRTEETTLQNAVTSAAGSSNSPVILQALTECSEEYLSALINSGTIRGDNACNSTSDAVDHYVRGDEEMAGSAGWRIPGRRRGRGQHRKRTASAGNLPGLPDPGAIRDDAARVDASGNRAKGYGQDLVATWAGLQDSYQAPEQDFPLHRLPAACRHWPPAPPRGRHIPGEACRHMMP